MDKEVMEVLRDVLEYKKREARFLFIALVVSLCLNLAEVGAFLFYESQWEYSDTVTTTTQSVDGDDGSIVNGDQYNDESQNKSGDDK